MRSILHIVEVGVVVIRFYVEPHLSLKLSKEVKSSFSETNFRMRGHWLELGKNQNDMIGLLRGESVYAF